MEQIIQINEKNLTVEIADTFIGRFWGLMFRRQLDEGHGLLIAPCNSVHMMFMRFSIDVVYLDKDYIIKKIVRNLRTWIGISICSGAYAVLELASGEAERLELQVGQKLNLR